MEPVLVTLAFVSLALACGMSIVAWKLLRDRHDRAAARAEALHALAFEGTLSVSDDRSHDLIDDLTQQAEPAPRLGVRLAGFERQSELPLRPEPLRRAPDAWEITPQSRATADLTPVLFEPPVVPANGSARRWLAVAAVALVLAAGVATAYALRSPEVVAAVAASRSTVAGVQPLELLSLQHRVDGSGGFQVTGLVQNPPAGALLRDVVAVVYLFDEQGNYFATGRATLNLGQVAPGDEAPFVVTFPNAIGVSRYRVGFRYDHGGGVVAHIDHRAPMSGTSGASTEPTDTPAAAAAPRRSEG